MDIEKLVKFVVEYVSEYLSVLGSTLGSAKLGYPAQKPQKKEGETDLIVGGTARDDRRVLNPKLFIYCVINIFVGFTLQSLVQGKLSGRELTVVVVVTLLTWVTVGTIISGIMKLLRGSGTFIDTLSLCIQLFSTVYLVSSGLTLLWSMLVEALRSQLGEGSILLVLHPFSLYFVVQFVLLIVYLPWGVKKLHRISTGRSLVGISILVVPFLLFNVVAYLTIQIPTSQMLTAPEPRPEFEKFVGAWKDENSIVQITPSGYGDILAHDRRLRATFRFDASAFGRRPGSTRKNQGIRSKDRSSRRRVLRFRLACYRRRSFVFGDPRAGPEMPSCKCLPAEKSISP